MGIDALCEKYNIARQLSWEAIMRCGMGLCGNCKIEMPDTWDEPSDKPGSKSLVGMPGRTDQFYQIGFRIITIGNILMIRFLSFQTPSMI